MPTADVALAGLLLSTTALNSPSRVKLSYVTALSRIGYVHVNMGYTTLAVVPDALHANICMTYVHALTRDQNINGQIGQAYISFLTRADRVFGGGAAHREYYQEDHRIMLYTDLMFPPCISYGSTHAPSYLTDKTEVLSGSEQRNARRNNPRHIYTIQFNNMSAEEIAVVDRLFHVCSGELMSFLFLDPLDHSSNDGVTWISEEEITSEDQLLGVAVGNQSVYPLYKYYTIGAQQKRRRIRHLQPNSLLISVDGFDVTNAMFNEDTHEVIFTQSVGTLTFSGAKIGNTITGADFSGLNENDLLYVDGFTDPSCNRLQGTFPLRVISSDANSVTLQSYDGFPYVGTDEAGVNITTIQGLPPAGATVRCGYYFYTAVRFDMDQMGITPSDGLRETMVGTVDNIILREVFE